MAQAQTIKKIRFSKCKIYKKFRMTKMPPLNKPPKPH